jgi:hypothetical protein
LVRFFGGSDELPPALVLDPDDFLKEDINTWYRQDAALVLTLVPAPFLYDFGRPAKGLPAKKNEIKGECETRPRLACLSHLADWPS